jgi:predicted dehydrogenase
MTALRGAIIGFGNVARHGHWPAYQQSAAFTIVAVVDPSGERRALARDLEPALRVYASLDELVRQETIEFVDVCTPPAAHAALAATALRNGWHVLCEKPLALDVEAYRRLWALANRSARVLFTVHNWKTAPIVRAAFEAIGLGAIGAVRHVDLFTWRNAYCKGTAQGAGGLATGAAEDWRQQRDVAGGGILVDHGWHAFYLVTTLVNAAPERVRASLHFPAAGPDAIEDAVDAVVRFPQSEACLHLTWRASDRRNLVIVDGDGGTIVVDDDRLLVMPRDGPWTERQFETPLSGGSHHTDWFHALLSGFGEEIENPAKRGANLREAGWCVALTAAAYRSGQAESSSVDVRFPDAPV